jgi:hypothetical protein
MKLLSCASTRRRLQAFHDEELPLGDQIAVSLHLERCVGCAASLEDLQFVSAVIRAGARAQADSVECLDLVESGDGHGFEESVISRLSAEEGESFGPRFKTMFEDMRLVYAGLCAGVAAIACFVVMFNVMRSVREERNPQSLAAMVKAIGAGKGGHLVPVSAARGPRGSFMSVVPVVPVVIDARLLMPGASSTATYAADSDADVVLDQAKAEFAVRGVVTREGRVTAVELVRAGTGEPVDSRTEEARALKNLIGAVARGRYEPASVNGLPVAVNKIWLVPHTTVHGNRAALETPAQVDPKKPLVRAGRTTGGRAPRPV